MAAEKQGGNQVLKKSLLHSPTVQIDF